MLCCWHKDLISKCASLLVPHSLDLVKFALHVRHPLIFTANIIAWFIKISSLIFFVILFVRLLGVTQINLFHFLIINRL